jgi:hypothetical protein
MTRNPASRQVGAAAPDLRAVPGTHPTISRDHQYKRHGTVTLMAGIDLLTGQVHAFARLGHELGMPIAAPGAPKIDSRSVKVCQGPG